MEARDGCPSSSWRAGTRCWRPRGFCIVAPLLLPLLFSTQNPVYLLEAVLIGLVLAVKKLPSPGIRGLVVLLALAAAMPSLPESMENMRWQAEQRELAAAPLVQGWGHGLTLELGEAPPP